MDNVLAKSNKWEMDCAGVLNYWYYSVEEFPFENGHLVIRGQNGSGKSVTTQSFLPLLLDGNKNPERLDPFNSRARKIIDYIFGENPEQNEKTSYLYLRFKKRFTEEYITVGIGLKGNKNNDRVDAWYFLIKNKRIGQDIELYQPQLDQEGNKVMVPLSHKQLFNLVVEQEKCGYVVDNPSDYADLVNNYIFKFKTIEEYHEMIKLVVRIRTPKLSNDLGPKVIYDILQRSLPELGLNDLRSLSETIQNMDEIKDRLNKTKDDLKLIRNLSSKYQDYNKAVLSKKAADFLETERKKGRTEKEIKIARKELENAKILKQEKEYGIQKLKDEHKTLETKLSHLKNNDVFIMKQNLIGLETSLELRTGELKTHTENSDEKNRQYREIEAKIKSAGDSEYEIKSKISLTLEELDSLAEDIDYVNHEANRDNFEVQYHQKNPLDSINQWRVGADEHKTAIEKIIRLLNKEKDLENQLEGKRNLLAQLGEEKRKKNDEIKKEKEHLEEKLEILNREITVWNDNNQEFALTEKELKELIGIIFELFETTELSDLEKQVFEYYTSRNEKMISDRADISAAVKQLDLKIKDKLKEIQELENKKDPEPKNRRIETALARKNLQAKKIPFAPFYETIEFKDGMKPEERERIESALLEMAILDSLVVPAAFIHLVDESDSVLVPQPLPEGTRSLHDYLSVCLSVEHRNLEEMVAKILSSIAVEEIEKGTFVTTFGVYQHGVVKGYAVPNEASVFIGKESRKRYRLKLLDQLRTDLEKLNEERNLARENINKITRQQEVLLEERKSFPSSQKVKEVNKTIDQLNNDALVIETDITRTKQGLETMSNAHGEIRRERMDLTNGRTTKIDVKAYEEVETNTKEYIQQLIDLTMLVKDLVSIQKEIQNYELQLEQVDEDIEILRDYKLQKEREVGDLTAIINGLKEALKNKNADDLEKQIDEAERRKQAIPKIIEDLTEELGGIKNNIPLLVKAVGIKEAAVTFYHSMYKAKRDLFVNELNRKFVEAFDKDTLSNDEDIKVLAHTVVEDDQEGSGELVSRRYKTISDTVTEIKVLGLEDYSITDTDYTYPLPEISDEGSELFSKELEELEAAAVRFMVTINYDGRSLTPVQLKKIIEDQIKAIEIALTTEDEKLYREIIMDNVGEKLRELISRAESWKDAINFLMSQRDTSSGLKLSLEWKPIEAKDLDEMKTSELVRLLQRDPDTLRESDLRKISKHFNYKIQEAKELFESEEGNKDKSFDYVIKDVLDYRKWFDFKLSYRIGEEPKKELTKNRFNALSGGERAMSMYIPLLSALYSRYSSADEEAPYIISMDEAFAGVDENNIRDMFELMEQLDLNYILNSQSLWGDYDTVKALSIAEIIRPKNEKKVTVILYKWDGKERKPVHEFKETDKPLEKQEIALSEEQQSLFDELELEFS